MTTIINNPPEQITNEFMGDGFIIGILIALLIGLVFFVYGLPLLKVTTEENPLVPAKTIQIETPALGTN